MHRKMVQIVFVAAVFGLMLLPAASADSGNEEMLVTIKNAPVDVPGQVLPPGKYDFKFTNDEHKIVVITTADGRQPVGFFEVIPITRPDRLGRVKVDLTHPEPGSISRIRDFFYPGMKTGYKFIYTNSSRAISASGQS